MYNVDLSTDFESSAATPTVAPSIARVELNRCRLFVAGNVAIVSPECKRVLTRDVGRSLVAHCRSTPRRLRPEMKAGAPIACNLKHGE
ncbi:hypothetical protein [Paraburkholderia sacchari]|uniref:hypothetical protein n=1 Tax=Paraburkholderia sacchari TaxID=159450 RepID=UPI003D974998